MSNVLKCSVCNIVIDELLSYIQNKISVIDEVTLIRICTTAFSSEEIQKSKDLLFDTLSTDVRKISRKRQGKERRDLEDIIGLFKTTEPDEILVFVAKQLEKLPPITFDHLDCTKLLKDLLLLKEEIVEIKSTYASIKLLEDIKNEVLVLKNELLVSPHYPAKKGCAMMTNSGLTGRSHLSTSNLDRNESSKSQEINGDTNSNLQNNMTCGYISDGGVQGHPSTCTFTKAITETYIAENHGNIPTVIVKPSMVSPAISEPFKGWTESWYSGTPLLHHVGKGWNVITYGDKTTKPDIMPVDYLANLIIVSAAKLQGSKAVQVYSGTSGAENPVTWAECFKYFTEECIKKEYNEAPFMFHTFTRSKIVVEIVTIIFQKLPAYVADFWLKIRGKEPRYIKIISRVEGKRNSLDYYTSRSWVFKANRAQELYSKLSPEDQKLFPFNTSNIVWSQYIKDYCNGVFKYLKPKYTARI